MTFLLDSSVVGRHELFEAAAGRHRLLIPALALAELLFQDRRRRTAGGKPYDPAYYRSLLARHASSVDVLPLDASECEAAAERLATRFPDDNAWLQAKREVARACCAADVDLAKLGAHRDCGAPVDLYLAALASPDRPIVTAEKHGFEWRNLPPNAVLDVGQALDLMARP